MPFNRPSAFSKVRQPNNRAPSRRNGVFGNTARAPIDRASGGLQKARNAVQGRVGGGNRRVLPRNATANSARQRQQLASQRVGNLRSQYNTPTARPNNIRSNRYGI